MGVKNLESKYNLSLGHERLWGKTERFILGK